MRMLNSFHETVVEIRIWGQYQALLTAEDKLYLQKQIFKYFTIIKRKATFNPMSGPRERIRLVKAKKF